MRKFCLLTSFIIFYFSLHAQNDFFILRKNDKKISQYFVDKYIYCELTNQSWIGGTIKKIQNDSVFIAAYHVNYLPTIWGTYVPDTVKDGNINIPVKDIYAFPNKENSPVSLISKVLQVGGAGYDLLNVINSLGRKQAIFRSNNLPYLISGAGVFIAGKILRLFVPPKIAVVGKNYNIQYMGKRSAQ